jgi:hypothetical protein
VPSLVLGVLVVVLLELTLPPVDRQPLLQTSLWGLVVLVSFAGWGSLVKWIVASPAERVDLGLRLSWGASAMLFVGGILMVPSVMTRDVSLLMIDIGVALSFATLVRERAGVAHSVRLGLRLIRREQRLSLLLLALAAFLAVHYLAGVTEWHTNPYDDDIAYLGFVRKLHDTGSFPEPFSFRRLASLGGQTFFLALVAIRAAANQANTFDRGVCILVIAALIAGHRVGRRRPSILFLVPAMALVPTLPLIAINTAPHFSAIAFFVALFRTAVWTADRPRAPWKNALPIALVAMTVCTLRQNFLPIPVVFLAVMYGARLHALVSRSSAAAGTTALLTKAKAGLAEPLAVCLFTAIALLPWLITAWQSNGTFLYPVMLGTFNKALLMQSTSTGVVHEMRLFVWTLLEGVPLPTLGIFVLGALLLREKSDRKPVLALLVAAFAGLALLVHALSQGDAQNLGRYACAALVAFALCASLSAGLERWRPSPRRSQLAAVVVLGALLLQPLQQPLQADASLSKFYGRVFRNLEEAAAATRPNEAADFWVEAYKRAQGAVPPGQRIAVLVDEPYRLDFRRNPIWNLDMPGYSSLAPGMPFFLGSQKVEDYFRGIGVRYLAFVRPDRSKYHYRREYWLRLLVDETEVWRAFAPYIIDMLDNLMEIAGRHKHLYDADTMIVLDLAEPGP